MASTIQGYAAAAGLPTDPNQLLAMMPAQVQGDVHDAMATYGTLEPAIAVAQQVSAGGVPSETAIIGALSSAASVVSPVAGAAMAAAGSIILGAEGLMQAFFDVLGLYDHPRLVKCCGLRVAASIPYGPGDPTWTHFDTYDEWHYVDFGHLTGLAAGEQCDYGNGGSWADFCGQFLGQSLLVLEGRMAKSFAPTGFDTYYAALLRADLEAWANCNPYMSPRQLLYAAGLAWNQAHAADATVSYAPIDLEEWGNPSMQDTLVSRILGNAGDETQQNTRRAPLVINTGAPVQAEAKHLVLHLHAADIATAARAGAPPQTAGKSVVLAAAVGLGALALFRPALFKGLLSRVGLRV